MKCNACGHENANDSKFCVKCRASLTNAGQGIQKADVSRNARDAYVNANLKLDDFYRARDARDALAEELSQAQKTFYRMIIWSVVVTLFVLVNFSGVSQSAAFSGLEVAVMPAIVWGVFGILGFMKGRGWFVSLNPIILLCMLALFLMAAGFVGIPSFVLQIKKCSDLKKELAVAEQALSQAKAQLAL